MEDASLQYANFGTEPVSTPPPPPLQREQLDLSNNDGFFREAQAPHRILLLRGVNFGSKTPNEYPNTAKVDGKRRTISFTNRPCALKDCAQHFARIRAWGFTLIRLLVTWEAVEPNAPGEYDQEYLEFLRSLCALASQHGLSVIIDPHQDVWSRASGGDGAPSWTLELAGFNIHALHETNAAVLHHEAMARNESYPIMIWPTNYAKLASATMFTLFFAGNEFAPKTKVGEQGIQDFLQDHYVRAMAQVARVLAKERNVLGFDTLNEPSVGYIGMEDLTRSIFPLPLGLHTSAFTGMQLGAGFTKRVNRFSPRPFCFESSVWVNPNRTLAWRSAEDDVWRNNGVWDVDAQGQPRLLRPGHFKLAPGSDFTTRYLLPLIGKLSKAIRSESHDYLLFAEPAISLLEEKQVLERAPSEALDVLGGRFAWAPHMYDGGTLMTKTYHSWFALDAERGTIVLGTRESRRLFERMGRTLRQSGNGWPVLVGETGVPMDMYGDRSAQALDRVLSGFEQSFLSWTLWNYMPGNSKEFGDEWNGEDLSLFSDGRARSSALRAAIRPYAMKLAGEPLETWFDLSQTKFFLKLRIFVPPTRDSTGLLETEVYIPRQHYPNSITWQVGGRGSSILKQVSSDVFVWRHDVSPGATSVEPNELFVDQWLEIEARRIKQ